MTPLETLLVVFSVLIVGGTSYELYNETKSHHRSKHHHRSERLHHKSASKSNKDFFGLFNSSPKNKSKKISGRTSRKLFNNTLEKKKTSNKLRSERHRKRTPSMTSSEKRQYYLNKFKHNVHKTKKRRRRIYI